MQWGRTAASIVFMTLVAVVSPPTVVHALLHADDQLTGVTKASNLIGKQVKDPYGKDLGDIKELVVNWRDGGYIEYAVLSFGGFLGLGDKYFAVPWGALTLSGDKKHFILNVKEESLKNAPGFDKDNWPDMSRSDYSSLIYQFYHLDPSAPKYSGLSSAEVSQRMKGEGSVDFKNTVQEALKHAMEAKTAGKQGNAEALVTHAKQSLDSAKRAQRGGYNEQLNEGVYALGEAIEHGEKQQATDATEHMMHAIMKLSQSAGLQIPEGVTTGRPAAD
jgi:sporulation protein YlmC with PRC-barrel domain